MKIVAQNVSVSIGSKPVVEGCSVDASPGETLALVGPSGSGKTTLLNVLGLLQRNDGGAVLVDGVDATSWNDRRRRRFWQQHAAFVFQDYGLIDEETVEHNVAVARLSTSGIRSRERSAIDAALVRVGLEGRGREKVSTLSGGEKQRVGLARAMFRRADVIFADEATASLDAANRRLVSTYLLGEAARGATVVIATHDDELMSLCDRRLALKAPGA
jgi:putative ABC transport system ATP-binding protein